MPGQNLLGTCNGKFLVPGYKLSFVVNYNYTHPCADGFGCMGTSFTSYIALTLAFTIDNSAPESSSNANLYSRCCSGYDLSNFDEVEFITGGYYNSCIDANAPTPPKASEPLSCAVTVGFANTVYIVSGVKCFRVGFEGFFLPVVGSCYIPIIGGGSGSASVSGINSGECGSTTVAGSGSITLVAS